MRGLSLSLLPLALLVSISEASKNYIVTVGKGSQLKFDPETLTAAAGDTITYQFFAKVSTTQCDLHSSTADRVTFLTLW
jgi:plastocyanin